MAQPRSDADNGTRERFRGDIEGMRALAVLLVLLCHAGLPFVPGGFVGVDVFFVISGFLITGLLTHELASSGRVSLIAFYARRARRLLPAAGLVLAASLLLTYLYLPRPRWSATGWDVVASGLYLVNWRLAERSVDYLAADQAPSIVQHYWSLSVEEQFYLLWPLMLILAGGYASWRTRRRPPHQRCGWLRARLLTGLALIGVPSFVWSVHLTGSDPGRGYFVTTTRMWELALGGAVALLAAGSARPSRLAAGSARPSWLAALPAWLSRLAGAALAWAGLAAVVGAGLFIEPSMAFPGYLALLPAIGTAAMICGGPAAGRAGPGRFLSLRPVRAVGAASYSLYLWHWPLLVAATARLGELTPVTGLAVVAGSVVPAVLCYRYVENPLRRSALLTWSPARAMQLGAVCTAVPVIAGALFQFTVWSNAPGAPPLAGGIVQTGTPGQLPQVTLPGAPGATVLAAVPRGDQTGAPTDHVEVITPDPVTAKDDLPAMYRQRCDGSMGGSVDRPCVYGDRSGSFTVALVGDSHAGQWASALDAVAVANRWRLLIYTRSSCPFLLTDVYLPGSDSRGCREWNDAVRSTLTGPHRPDLLVTGSSLYQPMRGDKRITGPAAVTGLAEDMRRTWTALSAAGLRTVVLRDTPQPHLPVAECASQHRSALSRCAVARDVTLAGAGRAQEQAAAGLSGVHLLDLNDAICPTDRCAVVIGGVLVYRDTNHLTATYALSLAPRLRGALAEIAG